MKNFSRHVFLSVLTVIGTIIACANHNSTKIETSEFNPQETQKKLVLSEDFKNYWYAGNAEITSFELQQARYGEIHKGKAVLIYVTEEFNPDKQVKADNSNAANIPILKLNSTKKFNTGIYPYSTMTSTFAPLLENEHATKVTFSMQEWCGHVFTQLNNTSDFEIQSYSYFESESDQKFNLPKAILENELWTQIRINPEALPIGKLDIIPSFEYSRMRHKTLKAYTANAILEKEGNIQKYSISYPDLHRTLTIRFNANFPYDIIGWEENFVSGFGSNSKVLTTTATKVKQLKTPYWSKNKVRDSFLRDSLGI